MSGLAAAAVFERTRSPRAQERDRRLLSVAAGLQRFTAREVALKAGDMCWYGSSSTLLRTLRREGHLRVVSPPKSTPFVYEWCDE